MLSTRLGWCLVGVLAGGIVACGPDEGGPTRASDFSSGRVGAFDRADASFVASTAVLSGRVLDAVTGAAVAGALVESASGAAATSDADGRFSLSASGGVTPLLVEAEGYWTRETRLRADGRRAVEIDLLPRGDDRFDLDFFDHLYRNLGEDGTHPWTSEPEFQILDRAFDCVELDHQGYCELYEATAEGVPPQFVALAREVVTTDALAYTGGVVTGSNVRVVAVSPGTRFRRGDAWVRNTVRLLLLQLPNSSSWATYWYYRGRGDMYSGLISINKRHKALRGVYSHEVAHTLGYAHPRGGHEVPLPSIMRYGHGTEPDPNDRLHGRLLYRRPPGSRSPDRDPDDFVLNAARTLDPSPGELVEVTEP